MLVFLINTCLIQWWNSFSCTLATFSTKLVFFLKILSHYAQYIRTPTTCSSRPTTTPHWCKCNPRYNMTINNYKLTTTHHQSFESSHGTTCSTADSSWKLRQKRMMVGLNLHKFTLHCFVRFYSHNLFCLHLHLVREYSSSSSTSLLLTNRDGEIIPAFYAKPVGQYWLNFGLRCQTCTMYGSTDGSVVEFSPATREARVRFPVRAHFSFSFW